MSTTAAIQTIIALRRAAFERDLEAGEALLPRTLPEAQGLLMTAISIIEAVTAGPQQEQILDYLIKQAEAVDGNLPEPDAEQ
ncbi:hypothetical protein [Pseudarthrobacter oxydans]|uniref:hypothetical protein n=1 Tax=Pseudarthrobacter oxydans TaxID=1671 RepID=UPI002AA74B68|nr:hypothetical protein [Pseudarthrobacter oxydans]WPU08100.1 hypothetical protein SMD14_13095 [Pseudarthrobacter oxydans]